MAGVLLTDQNFEQEVMKSSTPVLVDFWAPWCGPCKIIGPIVEELATEYEGKVRVGKLNVDENPQVVGQLGIMSLPTLMVFKNGHPLKSVIGAQPKAVLKQAMDEVLAS